MGKIEPINRSLDVRSVFISDVHLGFPGCAAGSLLDFLSRTHCETLYLAGDIVDFWYLRKRGYWPAEHNDVLQQILRMAQRGVRVVLIPGNHDERLRAYCGMTFGSIEVHDQFIHVTADGRRLLVIHGDQFDSVVRCSPLLVMVGSNLYDGLLRLNIWVNRVRHSLGKDYWSLSAALKGRVKEAVKYISRYEEAVARAARRARVDGVICGHIHRAEISDMDGLLYMNCGDWVESCTALMEHKDGRIELLHWPARHQVTRPVVVAERAEIEDRAA